MHKSSHPNVNKVSFMNESRCISISFFLYIFMYLIDFKFILYNEHARDPHF